MTAGELGPAGGLGHDPSGRHVVVEPAGVVDDMGQHMRHPAGGGAIDSVHAAERTAGNDLLHLAIMDAVTMLMAHHGLDAGFANAVAHLEQLLAREGDGFLERDQLRAALDAELDHVQAHVRRRAKAEDVRFR